MHLQSNKYILMVFEGQKSEPIIVNNLKQYFLNEQQNTIIYALYGNVIYDIYEKLNEDDFLDVVPVLKEFAQNRHELANISRDDVSEIYLFFDHDGHSHLADQEKLKKMLQYFNDETDHGKLYVSYPMVEALKHLGKDINFKELTSVINDNSKYKQRVDSEADNKFKQIRNYTKEIWIEVVQLHAKKLGYIMKSEYEYLNQAIDQYEILKKQKEQYIDPDNEVAVLGAFPIFLVDYYGYKIIEENL
jgi:hypothetical protein